MINTTYLGRLYWQSHFLMRNYIPKQHIAGRPAYLNMELTILNPT